MTSNSFSEWIACHDLFGHQIHLNLNGKQKHNTVLGGVCSLVIKILFLIFLINRVIILFDRDGSYDTISTQIQSGS